MRSFWSEPFLWIHLAGLTALPIFLALAWLGLAVGDPILPGWAELFLLALVGIAPVLLMQLSRPFYIFSIIALATQPVALTLQQRRLLSQFRTQANQVLAVVTAVLSLGILWQIYSQAPLAAEVAPFPLPEWRPVGLLLAGLAFLASNLFLQVPASVARVMLTKESALSATEPHPIERIQEDFTIPGWRVNQILPLVVDGSAKTKNDEL